MYTQNRFKLYIMYLKILKGTISQEILEHVFGQATIVPFLCFSKLIAIYNPAIQYLQSFKKLASETDEFYHASNFLLGFKI